MAVTNLTGLTNTTNSYQVLVFVNDSTGGLFIFLTTITLFFMLLMIFIGQGYKFEEGLLGSSFLLFGICLFLRFLQLITFKTVLIYALIAGASLFWVYLAKK